MKKVLIFTDGSCLGNPGRGGWAAILRLHGTSHERELGGGFRLTTNNRMELMAPIEALRALKEPCEVDIFSDSQYFCNAIEKKWLLGWQRANFMRRGKAVPNADLWRCLIETMHPHKVSLHWLRGHAGHAENERCDTLARTHAKRPDLPPDVNYEASRAREKVSGN